MALDGEIHRVTIGSRFGSTLNLRQGTSAVSEESILSPEREYRADAKKVSHRSSNLYLQNRLDLRTKHAIPKMHVYLAWLYCNCR